MFKTTFAQDIFRLKYAQGPNDAWDVLARRMVDDVCGKRNGRAEMPLMPKDELDQLTQFIIEMKFLPGGRYLYYAGRPVHYWNNCFLLKPETDSREAWANMVYKATSCLMAGGGIGADYSIVRPSGRLLRRTGGISSGPMSLISMINEVGRNVMQGGSRRSAIYGSLNWNHDDIGKFIYSKDWDQAVVDLKANDFNFPAPLDMTNISVSWTTDFLKKYPEGYNALWLESCRQMLMSGEPGHSYNFGVNEKEVLRNAPLSGDTSITTTDGPMRIKDTAGMVLPIWTGKRFVETTFLRTKRDAEIIKVGMTGGREIKAEPSHEFFVERWHGVGARRKLASVDKVAAKDLKVGDTLHVSLPGESTHGFRKVAYTLGFMYGDGHFGASNGELSLCTDEKKQCLKYMNPSMFTSIDPKDARGFIRCYVRKAYIEGQEKGVYPRMPGYDQASFLAGLFDADGSYDSGRGLIRLNSIHKSFLEDARRVLEGYGILAGVTTAGLSGFSGSQGYCLHIMAEFVNKFRRVIPTKRLWIQPHYPYRASSIKVISLEPGEPEDVYCCDVGVEEHSFQAEGVIVSNCTEITSADDSDCCNLGSVNMAACKDLEEFGDVLYLAGKFLVNGSIRGDLPYKKVYKVRAKNRRIGLGIMGVHEWLLQRNKPYEVTDELKIWLERYKYYSELGANDQCDHFFINRPVKYRAVAPTGTIGILASTTTGIEPLFAVAYKRRYLTNGTQWKYQYVIDATADRLIKAYDLKPEDIETAYSLAADPEKRIKFQAHVQQYVDHAISSTINLPAWGTEGNNEDTVKPFADLLRKYCEQLRGITVYPDGSRGGQPLTTIPYQDAIGRVGIVYDETEEKCAGGVCGI